MSDAQNTPEEQTPDAAGLSRRGLMGLALGAGATGLVVGAGGGLVGGQAYALEQQKAVKDAAAVMTGIHQPGITCTSPRTT